MGLCKRVEYIFSGKFETGKILYDDPSPDIGYIILPDMKWDLTTLSSLYLVAITHSKNIRSLRDLRKTHLGMLRSIRREAARVVEEQWGFKNGMLRMFVHYHPSYCESHLVVDVS